MKTEIVIKLSKIDDLAKMLDEIVEEKLDNEFAGILQKWADVTKSANLNGNLKRLQIYVKKVEIYDSNEIYYLKAGSSKLYKKLEYDYLNSNFKYESYYIFSTLDTDDKIAIINNLNNSFDDYIGKMQKVIETIKTI